MPKTAIERRSSGPAPTRPTTVTLEDLWKVVGFTPNAAQEAAIRHVDGPLYLPAGPGSGKTRVLLWRALNLVVFQGVPPEQIFLGTFTEKAAHQLREGFRGLLAVASERCGTPFDISRMAIGTIHSICRRLLQDRRLGQAGARPMPPALLDEFAQHQFVYGRRRWDQLIAAGGTSVTVINRYFLGRDSTSRHHAVRASISFFNRCSEESIDPKTADDCDDEMGRSLVRMNAKYLELLATNPRGPLTDLSRLQSHAFNRIDGDPATDELFRHVIVDEYQDTNSIQERIYFRLARATTNLCVVGDDDQALYRFRGATVDNFLAFPDRCRDLLGRTPQTVPLIMNYRSRPGIVKFYNRFMGQIPWRQPQGTFRVDKEIVPASQDNRPSVFHASPGAPADVADEVARAVKRLVVQGRVKDPNEVAFLFPSLGSTAVDHMRRALEAEGLQVYAPRAGTFMEVEEARQIFGLFLAIFGKDDHQHQEFDGWLDRALDEGRRLVRDDPKLARFVKRLQEEIETVVTTERKLLARITALGATEETPVDDETLARLSEADGLPEETRRFLRGRSLAAYLAHQRERRPDRPITLRYVVNRACSLDWGLLDLFYQLTAFDAFKAAFDTAEAGTDEGPICNLSLISDYIARFQEQRSPVISAQFLSGRKFLRVFFSSFLYSIYRLEQGEYEDKQDPFPKGRIPFLTVHQAKGLEFPVVVLANLRKDIRSAGPLERLMVELGVRKRETLDLAPTFDAARMYYVALSRPMQVLILCPFRGRGQRYNAEFDGPMNALSRPLRTLDPASVDPDARTGQGTVPRPYSFTGDFISYGICPRRYMIYRRYGFVPSRNQTTIFGNLVHQTIEDLHQWLMSERAAGKAVAEEAP